MHLHVETLTRITPLHNGMDKERSPEQVHRHRLFIGRAYAEYLMRTVNGHQAGLF